MSLFDAFILGLVQGASEFLPVSSTGHLILVREWLHIGDVSGLAFDATLHLGTALAVLIYFWKDIVRILKTAFRILFRAVVPSPDRLLLGGLIVGTLPALFLGFLFQDFIEATFRNGMVIAGALIGGSVIFVAAEMILKHRVKRSFALRGVLPTLWQSLTIGFFQTLAFIPGMSRSGMTISGGLMLGLSREAAARFGFLLSFPIILGAGMLKLFSLMNASGEVISWGAILLGGTTAFVSGLIAIWGLLAILRRFSLFPFVWYRLLLAGVIIAITLS